MLYLLYFIGHFSQDKWFAVHAKIEVCFQPLVLFYRIRVSILQLLVRFGLDN